jgi:hypothetical protein
MKLEIHLDANETTEDINTLSLANALLNFIDDHNSAVCMKLAQNFVPFIFAKDIADIIYVLHNSSAEYVKRLEERNNNANT